MPKRFLSRPLISWAFYDFANTIFSAVILTSFFPLYFTKLAGKNWILGFATTSAMIVSGLVIPFLGALSDQTGKTKAYLIRSTLACIFFVSFLSFFKQVPLLVFFFAGACFFFHASLVFYNSLLPVVASQEDQGFASGLGVGLGYLGVVLVLPLAGWMSKTLGESSVFIFSGILFLIFSIPLFLWVPERKVLQPISFRWALWKTEWHKILKLIRSLKDQPDQLGFFVGNFFVVDALNTIILWFSVYAREVFHPSGTELIGLLVGINLSACAMGLFSGVLTDRIGALKTFAGAIGILVISIFILTSTSNFKIFALTALTGAAFAIAGIWTAGRKVLVEMAPPEQVGEYFGLYGFTTKISIIGNLVFSIVADQVSFQAALRVLLFPSIVGFLFVLLSLKTKKF